MSRITFNDSGYPEVVGPEAAAGFGPSEPTEWRIGAEVFHLSDEHGKVMSPTQSLYALLDGGEVTEQVFNQIAARFDDPETLHVAARQLGVKRVKQADGKIALRLPEGDEVPKRDNRKALGITSEGYPIVATSRDAPRPEPRLAPATPTRQEHSDALNFADDNYSLFNDHASDPKSAIWITFKAAGKVLGEHGISIIGSGLKIHRDHNNPSSRERYVKVSDVKAILMQGRGGRGAAEVIDEQLTKARQQRSRDRYNRRLATGAAEVARKAIGGAHSTPGQDRDREFAQQRRAENSRRRRAATATRKTK